MHIPSSPLIHFVCSILALSLCANAQDSREGDSLALVAICSTNISISWNYADPINIWSGVTAGPNSDDRVTMLIIQNKNLNIIPIEISNLTKLERLILTNNNISEIPSEIESCVELLELDLEKNTLKTIPPEIGNLSKLTNFRLLQNIIDSLPPEMGNLSNLRELYLDNNNLRLLPTEIEKLSRLTIITLDNNSLDFDDIELMKGFVDEVYYNPQDTLGSPVTDTLTQGLKIGLRIGGSLNHYAWTRDGSPVGADSDSISVTESGVYICTITSDSITDLTLTHRPIIIVGPAPILVEKSSVPLDNFSIQVIHGSHKVIIKYQLPAISNVELTVYDINGQKVSTMISEQQLTGNYHYEWASHKANGTFFCQLKVGNSFQVRKYIAIK